MRTRLVASLAALGVAAPAALAQAPPVDGGVPVGGSVASYLELALMPPAPGSLARFHAAGTARATMRARVTATGATVLTLADGDVTAGARRGHLTASGGRRLAQPLEADAFTLDAGVVGPLVRWTEAVTRRPATIGLRQRVSAPARGPYRKVVLVTLSAGSP